MFRHAFTITRLLRRPLTHQLGSAPRSSSAKSLPTLQRSLHRLNSTASPLPSKDPSHPHLYYHVQPQPPPGRIALSFLPDLPVNRSRTVLGYLPLDGGAGLGDFGENPAFGDILHASIKDALAQDLADSVTFEASGRPGDGYIHITDERAVPPAGRIGETEDLIGSVFVQDNKVVADTYEPLPSYRLVTANGPLILPKGLDEHLVATLERIDREEKRSSS